ncbi:hypothetical protein BD408DRAFT_409252 [Parasitella parasitica]|nr:hypothetical protein BD408DRAFT_409252 [Parasitella parasitica]
MVDVLYRDWLHHPQMRYCTSQLLAGAILIEGATGIIINTGEPYSLDTLLDARHERRLLSAATSFPSKPNQYGFLSICQLSTPDGFKLIIGSILAIPLSPPVFVWTASLISAEGHSFGSHLY